MDDIISKVRLELQFRVLADRGRRWTVLQTALQGPARVFVRLDHNLGDTNCYILAHSSPPHGFPPRV
ncbi:unnamed protein product [Boreogadus saida]